MHIQFSAGGGISMNTQKIKRERSKRKYPPLRLLRKENRYYLEMKLLKKFRKAGENIL